MVTKEPRTTSKEIRGELQGQDTSVSDRIIRRCLSQSGLNGRQPRRTPLSKANHKKKGTINLVHVFTVSGVLLAGKGHCFISRLKLS
ncbi:hypothetical protein L3Q82_005738 [Scortum barcoo]|uniref:Uncharacterized protein n=1 Tax=Scortum barcoo TaxID=214431 RepID=A0ACB8V774_9TELE|nr:hypothetical protein L3Q82_005738 [Scortum barcoo]